MKSAFGIPFLLPGVSRVMLQGRQTKDVYAWARIQSCKKSLWQALGREERQIGTCIFLTYIQLTVKWPEQMQMWVALPSLQQDL